MRPAKRLIGDYLIIIIIALSTSAAFGFGMLAERANSKGNKDDNLWIENIAPKLPGSVESAVIPHATSAPQTQASAISKAPRSSTESLKTGNYVASKTGKMFYLPTCSTAKRIKEENKVWFSSKTDAEEAGYAPAKNCKGL